MKHSEEATAILIELDFLQKGPDGRFEAGKHVYPADRGERFSPTNPILFGITRSDCNVIVWGRYMVSRYLAKYVASIDEVRFYFVCVFMTGSIKSETDSFLMTPSEQTTHETGRSCRHSFPTRITRRSRNQSGKLAQYQSWRNHSSYKLQIIWT